jgi:hypothetical protein
MHNKGNIANSSQNTNTIDEAEQILASIQENNEGSSLLDNQLFGVKVQE